MPISVASRGSVRNCANAARFLPYLLRPACESARGKISSNADFQLLPCSFIRANAGYFYSHMHMRHGGPGRAWSVSQPVCASPVLASMLPSMPYAEDTCGSSAASPWSLASRRVCSAGFTAHAGLCTRVETVESTIEVWSP